MNAKPLYQSYRASFDKDIHLPICGITAAPTVVWEVLTADDLSVLSCPTPPQNVILHVTPELTVAGQPLYDGYRIQGAEFFLIMGKGDFFFVVFDLHISFLFF
jgi:hypothetical protein